jgi:hypothetical protein
MTVAATANLTTATAALSHHAFQGTVDVDTDVHVTATLMRVDWINPHTWLHFDITSPDGRVLQDVKMETLSVSAMRQAGIDSATLPLGKQYEVTYFPNRDGTAGGYVTLMVLPDGRVFDVMNRGKLVDRVPK